MRIKRLTFDIQFPEDFTNFVAIFWIFKSRKQDIRRPLGFGEQFWCSCSFMGRSDVYFITGGTPRIRETSEHKTSKSESWLTHF